VVGVLGTAVFSTAVEAIDVAAAMRRRKGGGGCGEGTEWGRGREGEGEGGEEEAETGPVQVCLKIIKNNKEFFDQG
jgi:hypothetical protein